MPNRPILVADDVENRTEQGKQRSQALVRAASWLAQKLKTNVELLYVEDLKSYPSAQLGSFRYLEWHKRHEDMLTAEKGRFAVPVSCTVATGSPAEQILQKTRSRPSPELVVMGTQGRKGVKRLLLGSVAEEVVRHAKRPVMVIGPEAREQAPAAAGRRQPTILVPTDLGKNSRAAEQYALSLAQRLGAGILLFHCLWDMINTVLVTTAYSGFAAFDFDRIITDSRNDAHDGLKQKQAFFLKHGVPCEYRIEEKPATSSCAVYRESEGCLLVVMGTHGRNIVLESFFGSTARETILHARVPVIVVHSGT